MNKIDYTKINNALEIIKEQRNIILCELLREFPIGCNITYINEDNIQTKAIVINHKITDDNIPKLDIKTLENKKIKLIPINIIIKKSLSDEVLKKQKIISELSSQFKISNATINDEKRIEILKAVLLQINLNNLTEFKLSSSIDKEMFVDFLLLDSKLSKPIMSMKFDKFTRTIDALVMNNQEFIKKHTVNKNYKNTILNELNKSILFIIVMRIKNSDNSNFIIVNENLIENK